MTYDARGDIGTAAERAALLAGLISEEALPLGDLLPQMILDSAVVGIGTEFCGDVSIDRSHALLQRHIGAAIPRLVESGLTHLAVWGTPGGLLPGLRDLAGAAGRAGIETVYLQPPHLARVAEFRIDPEREITQFQFEVLADLLVDGGAAKILLLGSNIDLPGSPVAVHPMLHSGTIMSLIRERFGSATLSASYLDPRVLGDSIVPLTAAAAAANLTAGVPYLLPNIPEFREHLPPDPFREGTEYLLLVAPPGAGDLAFLPW